MIKVLLVVFVIAGGHVEPLAQGERSSIEQCEADAVVVLHTLQGSLDEANVNGFGVSCLISKADDNG